MAFAPPQRYRTPNGADVFLPPEVAAGFVGFDPVEPPMPEPDPGAAAGAPSIPIPPPVDQSLLATPPTMPPPEDPTFAGAVGDLARPGLVQDVTPSPVTEPGPARAAPPTGPGQGGAPSAPLQPTTAADLMAGGYAPVLDQQREAMALERAAGVEQIAADKRSAEEEARAIAASGERDQAREAERARIQQATLADIAQRSAAIDGEIDRIANTKIDTSIRRPAVAAIAIAMGAIGAALAGKNDGSNPALDIILKQIDASAQRQMAERDAAVRTVGLKRDQLTGLRSKLTDTNALYDGLAAAETRRIRTEMARIGAASKSDAAKANLAKLDALLAGKEAEYLDGAKTKQFARYDAEQKRKEQERHAKEMESQGRQGLALTRRGQDIRIAEVNAENARAAAKYTAEATAKQREEDRRLGIGGGAMKDVVVDGKIVRMPDVIRNADGSVFRASSDGEAKELRDQKSAVDTVNDFVGQIVRGINDHGGESAYFKSEDWQRQKSRIAFAKNAIRVGEKMGTLDAGSEKMMDDMAGAVDPTSFWRNASAGLIQMRDNLATGFNNRLRAQPGYTGDGYRPPDSTKLAGPVKTPDDKRVDAALLAPSKVPLDQFERELGTAQGRSLRPQEAADKLRQAGGMLPSQRATVEYIAKAAMEAPKMEDRSKAVEQLDRLAKTAQSPAVRKLAIDLMQDVASAAGTPKSVEPLPRR